MLTEIFQFVFKTIPSVLYKYVVSYVLDAVYTVFGVPIKIFPLEVREHFSGSPQRILAFIFLVCMLGGIIQAVWRVLKKYVGVFSWLSYVTNYITTNLVNVIPEKLREIFSPKNLYENGFSAGKAAGRASFSPGVAYRYEAPITNYSGFFARVWRSFRIFGKDVVFILALLWIILSVAISVPNL